MNDKASGDLDELIKTFTKESEEIVNSFCQKLEEQPAPDRLYHYTSWEGLRGIIESGKLRFTDIFYLNDPSELRHGVGHAVDLLDVEQRKGPDELILFFRDIFNLWRGGVEVSAHYFVSCFSKDGDDLGQWRAYGDNGCGYALGFDGKLLEKAFAQENGRPVSGHMAFPITYDEKVLIEMHAKIVKALRPLTMALENKKPPKILYDEYRSLLRTSFALPIIRSALFFKHKAYTNEQEYRFIQMKSAAQNIENLQYLKKPNQLTRYLEFDWRLNAPNALKEIIVGPAANQKIANRFIWDCLRAFGGGEAAVGIRPSEIPYRTP